MAAVNNPGLILLDEAICLARQGLEAAKKGDIDILLTLSARWNTLKNTALDKHSDPTLREEFLKRCNELRELQEKITFLAKTQQNTVLADMQKSRKEQSRMRGYHDAIRQARH